MSLSQDQVKEEGGFEQSGSSQGAGRGGQGCPVPWRLAQMCRLLPLASWDDGRGWQLALSSHPAKEHFHPGLTWLLRPRRQGRDLCLHKCGWGLFHRSWASFTSGGLNVNSAWAAAVPTPRPGTSRVLLCPVFPEEAAVGVEEYPQAAGALEGALLSCTLPACPEPSLPGTGQEAEGRTPVSFELMALAKVGRLKTPNFARATRNYSCVIQPLKRPHGKVSVGCLHRRAGKKWPLAQISHCLQLFKN